MPHGVRSKMGVWAQGPGLLSGADLSLIQSLTKTQPGGKEELALMVLAFNEKLLSCHFSKPFQRDALSSLPWKVLSFYVHQAPEDLRAAFLWIGVAVTSLGGSMWCFSDLGSLGTGSGWAAPALSRAPGGGRLWRAPQRVCTESRAGCKFGCGYLTWRFIFPCHQP